MAGSFGVMGFDKKVPYAGLTWNLDGNFSTPSFDMNSDLSVNFPNLGTIVTAKLTVNLRTTGVGVTYTVSDNTHGSATFYVKDGGIFATLVATIDGTTHQPFKLDLGRIPGHF